MATLLRKFCINFISLALQKVASRRGPQSKITQKPASIFPDDDGAVLVG